MLLVPFLVGVNAILGTGLAEVGWGVKGGVDCEDCCNTVADCWLMLDEILKVESILDNASGLVAT